ncbi:MAG: 5'-3' exonuclease H3TH domain-containing protein, partial [Bryobacteraceae bacterium]
MPQRQLFLIDSFGFIFRAYHARARSGAPPMRTGKGVSTEAIYIFNNMLRKLRNSFHPHWIAAVFESDGPTLREQSFAEYKANRTETPPDLLEQIPYIRKIIEAMRIPILEFAGFEADDVIGTIACRAREAGHEVIIVSSDKDMLQLVEPGISMLNPAKDDIVYDEAKVEEFMGVKPKQVADLLALKGDAVDNIPGAPGIGDKGARDLLLRFGSVEGALEHAAEVERKTYRESLQNHREQILLSKQLATIERAVPIEFSMESAVAREPDVDALRALYKELEFNSLARELGAAEDMRPKDYRRLESAEEVEEYLRAIPRGSLVAVAVETGAGSESLDLGGEAAVGLSWKPGEARGIPGRHAGLLRPLLEGEETAKAACDAKTVTLAMH